MKRKFYEQLDVKIENEKSNNSFLSREKYELLIQEIFQLKRGNRKKEPKDYQLLKRHDVVQIGNTVKLIYPVAEWTFSIKCYAQKEDIFDAIHDAHLAIVHDGRNQMINKNTNKLQKYYSRKHHALLKFVRSLPQKIESFKKGLVIKPIIFSEMNSRAQVELIDMQN